MNMIRSDHNQVEKNGVESQGTPENAENDIV